MLKDSAHIQMFEAEWRNRKARRAGLPEVVPLYDMMTDISGKYNFHGLIFFRQPYLNAG